MPIVTIFVFIVAVVVISIYQRRNGGKRRCRWRQSRAGSRGSLMKYNCVTCGAEAFSAKGKPDRCLANLKSSGL
tara:strand:+ start:671 stop:892 length:222 start_codon:yes stop_codon:yes gene_type:complete